MRKAFICVTAIICACLADDITTEPDIEESDTVDIVVDTMVMVDAIVDTNTNTKIHNRAAVGARFWLETQHRNSIGIVYIRKFVKMNRFEMSWRVGGNDRWGGLMMDRYIQWHGQINDGLNWYAGVGGNWGLSFDEYSMGLALGLLGLQAGFEYDFTTMGIPLLIGFSSQYVFDNNVLFLIFDAQSSGLPPRNTISVNLQIMRIYRKGDGLGFRGTWRRRWW